MKTKNGRQQIKIQKIKATNETEKRKSQERKC